MKKGERRKDVRRKDFGIPLCVSLGTFYPVYNQEQRPFENALPINQPIHDLRDFVPNFEQERRRHDDLT